MAMAAALSVSVVPPRCCSGGVSFAARNPQVCSSVAAVMADRTRRSLGTTTMLPLGTLSPSLFQRKPALAQGSGIRARKRVTLVQARGGRGGSSVVAIDRVVAAVSYFLPFFDGVQYGRYFFMQFPAAERLLEPLFPLLQAYKSFPYASFVAFFLLYLVVVRNQSFSRYVRFNAMQAVVLDVLTIVPSLIERTFSPARGFGYSLLIAFYNTVFFFLVACFVFGVVSCMLGKTPRLPLVADAADAQV